MREIWMKKNQLAVGNISSSNVSRYMLVHGALEGY